MERAFGRTRGQWLNGAGERSMRCMFLYGREDSEAKLCFSFSLLPSSYGQRRLLLLLHEYIRLTLRRRDRVALLLQVLT